MSLSMHSHAYLVTGFTDTRYAFMALVSHMPSMARKNLLVHERVFTAICRL